MIPAELEYEIKKAIEQGKEPFFVNATSGTTVLGAYDPLESLANICKKYGVWLHVDVRTILLSLLGKFFERKKCNSFLGSLGRWCPPFT